MAAIVYHAGNLVLVNGTAYGDGYTPRRWRVLCRVLAGPTAAGQYHVQPVRWDGFVGRWLDRAESFWVFGHLIKRLEGSLATEVVSG